MKLRHAALMQIPLNTLKYVTFGPALLEMKNRTISQHKHPKKRPKKYHDRPRASVVRSYTKLKGIYKKSVDLCACANNVQNKANTEGNDESFSKCLTMCCALLARALRGVKNELMALLKILNLAR